jgi:hypothetical protein
MMRAASAAEGSDVPMLGTASATGPAAMTVAAVALLIVLGVLALLVLVLVGIRDEERHMSLTSAPRTRIGAVTRHLTGVGVRTPQARPGTDRDTDSPKKAI